MHPIIAYLKNKKDDNKKGCLRMEQAKAEKRKITGKQLTAYEWELVLKMRESMESSTGDNTTNRNKTVPTAALANVWGIAKRTLNEKKQKTLNNETLSAARKQRKDAGQTLLNNDKKRFSCLTAYTVFKKQKIATRELTDPITVPEIRSDWEALADEEKRR